MARTWSCEGTRCGTRGSGDSFAVGTGGVDRDCVGPRLEYGAWCTLVFATIAFILHGSKRTCLLTDHTTAPCCTLLGVVLLTVISIEALDHQVPDMQLDEDHPLLKDQARDLEQLCTAAGHKYCLDYPTISTD